MSTISLSSLAATEQEARLLADRGEEILGYAITSLLNRFSRRQAGKVIESFGISRVTGERLLEYIEHDADIRRDIAARLVGRMKLAAVGCAVGIGLAFVPAIPYIYVGLIAFCAVHLAFAYLRWRHYSQPVSSARVRH